MQTDVISEIIENKRREVEARRAEIPLGSFVGGIKKGDGRFKQAVIRDGTSFPKLIAELKFASPSSGMIRDAGDDEVLRILGLYDKYASAVSVLTDEKYFGGSLRYLSLSKENTGLAVLRKDFIIDEIQVYQSRALGADAILLIAKILSPEKLKKLYELTKKLGMDVVVEVHNLKELRAVLKLSPDIIGINNRNLDTFGVDLNVTLQLVPLIPKDSIVISESGIDSLKCVLLLKGAGLDAVLIGQALMQAPDIKKKLEEFKIGCKD